MRWRPTIEAVIAGATLVGCTAAHACLDDGTLVDTRSFKLAAQVPSAVQVEQRGQFVWLEAGKGNEYLRYSLPNDRTGMEVIYFEPPATAGSIELCVHTTFLHQAAGDKPAITFIDNAATLPSTQRARLQRFSEAARLWGQATASSQQQAFALLSELAADGGDDPQRILQWSRLAAARAALSLPNPRTTLALLEKYGAGLGGDTLFAVAAKKLQGLAELHLNDFPAAETSFHAALALSP
ncbi:MAG TPA: hypothetical protein VMH83_10985, partial [Candidatus Acidoferrum sp.]|nr:hypothetical protein [Candidatus Acidoferrum sp.]